MKRIAGISPILMIFIASLAFAEPLALDSAISASVTAIAASLSDKAKVAVIDISAPTETLANYLLEEISLSLFKTGRFVVIERKNLDLVKNELDLQLSGDVDDASAQSIGRFLGAEAIVTGSFDKAYRLRTKVVSVETAEILAVSSVDVARGEKVDLLAGVPGAVLEAVPAGFDNPAIWKTLSDAEGAGDTDIILTAAREDIRGKEYAVVTVEADIPSKFRYSYAAWAAVPDGETLARLRATKGIRFKVLGDGHRYEFRVESSLVTDGAWHTFSFETEKGQIREIMVPYKKLRQAWGKSVRFDRSTISGISFLARKSTVAPIKIFDIRPF